MNLKTARRLNRLFSYLPLGLYARMLGSTKAEKPSAAIRRTHEFTPDVIGGVSVGWINKKDATNGVLVQCHGGGYTIGPLFQAWDWTAELCTGAGVAAVLVDYRKAKDGPYPAAPDDVSSVLEALSADAGLQPGRWALTGDSAGGGLALIACRRVLDRGLPRPACVVVCSPWVDMRLDHPDIPEIEKRDPSLSRALLERSIREYAPGQDLSNPELSPTAAKLKDLPPVHLRYGTDEIFLPQLNTYRRKLEEAGVTVDAEVQDGGIHVYPTIVGDEISQRAIASQVAFLRTHLDAGASD